MTGRGLAFPEDAALGFFDFADFAYGVGTTFGTTDVDVCTPKMRRLVLGHGVYSFAYNTVIVALTVTFLVS